LAGEEFQNLRAGFWQSAVILCWFVVPAAACLKIVQNNATALLI